MPQTSLSKSTSPSIEALGPPSSSQPKKGNSPQHEAETNDAAAALAGLSISSKQQHDGHFSKMDNSSAPSISNNFFGSSWHQYHQQRPDWHFYAPPPPQGRKPGLAHQSNNWRSGARVPQDPQPNSALSPYAPNTPPQAAMPRRRRSKKEHPPNEHLSMPAQGAQFTPINGQASAHTAGGQRRQEPSSVIDLPTGSSATQATGRTRRRKSKGERTLNTTPNGPAQNIHVNAINGTASTHASSQSQSHKTYTGLDGAPLASYMQRADKANNRKANAERAQDFPQDPPQGHALPGSQFVPTNGSATTHGMSASEPQQPFSTPNPFLKAAQEQPEAVTPRRSSRRKNPPESSPLESTPDSSIPRGSAREREAERRRAELAAAIPIKAPQPLATYLAQAAAAPIRAASPQTLLVVLDLNGTLCQRTRGGGGAYARPYLTEFMAYMFAQHRVVIWSSARGENVAKALVALFAPADRARLVAVWGRETLGLSKAAFNLKVQVYKKLIRLWCDKGVQAAHPGAAGGVHWGQHNTVLVDDSIKKGASEPFNFVEVPEFTQATRSKVEEKRPTLREVAEYLEEARQWQDVSSYMKRYPFTPRDPAVGLASSNGVEDAELWPRRSRHGTAR